MTLHVRYAMALFSAYLVSIAAPAAAAPSTGAAPMDGRPVVMPHTAAHPWVEGVDPYAENRLFYATYGALKTHNVIKVYVFSAGGYESAGIRFSGRVPHESRDLTLSELAAEAVTLIRTTFDSFPDVQELDVWATIPVPQSDQTSVESTVFSVSADRDTYDRIASRGEISDIGFCNDFGRVWVAPQVPR